MTMQKIRIGKEFSVRWTLTVNGERTDLHSLPVTVILVYPSGRRKQMGFTAEGDELLIPVNRDVQKETGVYRLEAWVNKDKDGQTVTDCCNAFSLVERSCQESDEQTGSDVKLEQEIILSTSNIQMGVTGKSAYQVWLDNGNEGTEQDFLNWMKQPAEQSAAQALSAARQAETSSANANEKAQQAQSAASSASSAASEARQAASSASSTAEEGNKLIENLEKYEEALSGMPLYENAGETNEINI